MKIVFFEIEPWMPNYIQSKFPNDNLVFTEESLTEDTAEKYQDADIISVFVFSKITPAVLNKLSNCKLIAARSTGFDHIDVATAQQKNIITTNVPQYGSVTVAEHTWALILALSRRIFESYDRTEKANFSTAGLRGFDLHEKTLGLIGLGEIGRHVARISQGFGMKLRVFNRSRDHEFASQFNNFVFVDRVEDVYTHADVVSFHVPLTNATHHILNSNNYHLLKPGSIVVNTSRGGLIETQALVKALNDRIIRGAGLDVLESESLMKPTAPPASKLPREQELAEAYLNHILIGMDNVLITPHNAFNSDESIRRLIDQNVRNIQLFITQNFTDLDRVSIN